tara:strand:+ start:823 stop:2097 length:1275 start_codon:yes stop_codon:yes gene_type:complete
MDTTTLLVIIALAAICNVGLLLWLLNKSSSNSETNIGNSILRFQTSLDKTQETTFDQLERNRKEINTTSKENREELSKSLNQFEEKFSKNIKDIRETINNQLKDIRDDNTKQLEKMRDTVDKKLQKTLEERIGESFNQVSKRLKEVHEGLGEMQTIASDVGNLKKVLSNVKTRGVVGEFQLAAILEQILPRDNYSENVATKPGSQKNVEFAVKLPGKGSEKHVWLPIDSKFPIEPYHELMSAYDNGDKDIILKAKKALVDRIKTFAKDISSKYISPPNTTDFAIMFLPIEGLFAEVLREPDLMNDLMDKYKITLTGPTTLSAFLNSLQMGFRTLLVQKRSSEVWNILESVKTEFGKFAAQIETVDKHLNTASTSLNKLKTTRTNTVNRSLRNIQSLGPSEQEETIELSNPPIAIETEASEEVED